MYRLSTRSWLAKATFIQAAAHELLSKWIWCHWLKHFWHWRPLLVCTWSRQPYLKACPNQHWQTVFNLSHIRISVHTRQWRSDLAKNLLAIHIKKFSHQEDILKETATLQMLFSPTDKHSPKACPYPVCCLRPNNLQDRNTYRQNIFCTPTTTEQQIKTLQRNLHKSAKKLEKKAWAQDWPAVRKLLYRKTERKALRKKTW